MPVICGHVTISVLYGKTELCEHEVVKICIVIRIKWHQLV